MWRESPTKGLRTQNVPGVGQINTLPELRFALMDEALLLDVTADLGDGDVIEYQTRMPELESAVVLKAHSWANRRSEKDLADLHSLLEIREAHPSTAWRLGERQSLGFGKDTAQILRDLGGRVVRKHSTFPVPASLDRLRMAALIARHVPSRAHGSS